MSITLERVEQQLFHTLLQCVHQRQLPVTLRVAGGWVRDKLLGKASHDIDIAIDQMMGRPFVEHLCAYLQSDLDGGDSGAVHGVGVIKSNPERSKHLETATMMLCGLSVDFVNLRSESYTVDTSGASSGTCGSEGSAVSSGSRIPTKVEFGTPLQDALRRDITINSLFYNLHTEQVEDHCGSGLSDLHDGLIRTPMNPIVTLLDDPLRLLRVIRFAARFDYQIVPELTRALHDPSVHQAFRAKVSRERVGIEVDKMVSDRSVAIGMRYLLHEHVYPLIFTDIGMIDVDCDWLLRVYNGIICVHEVDPRLAAYCALMLPLASAVGGLKETPVLLALRDGLKLPSRDYQLITRLVDGIVLVQECDVNCPVSVGRVIMALGEHYKLTCLLADSHAILHRHRHTCTTPTYTRFMEAATRFNLLECHLMRPLVSGEDVKVLLSLGNKDGKRIGALLRRAVDLQLAFPEISRDELMERLVAAE